MDKTMVEKEEVDDVAEILSVVMAEEEEGMRLDKALSMKFPQYSRTRIQGLIDSGECLMNGNPCQTPSRKIEIGDEVVLSLPPLVDATPEPENIPLDILYEDDDLLVINKPAGMVVHPAVGNHTGTLVNALLYHCGDSLSGINGVKRPGIVHRLDKETSGLMMVAKNDFAHHHLSEQLQDRSLSRVYLALVVGVPFPPKGRVETLIGRHPSNRLKMSVVRHSGKESATNFIVRETYRDVFSLVECHLESGRTHQIRVHMEHAGFPLVGDLLYGAQRTKLVARLKKGDYSEDVHNQVLNFPHQALHATAISFIHPRTEEEMDFEVPLPDVYQSLIESLE